MLVKFYKPSFDKLGNLKQMYFGERFITILPPLNSEVVIGPKRYKVAKIVFNYNSSNYEIYLKRV